MSRKNSILIILAIVLLMIGGLVFFYFYNNNNKIVPTVTTTPSPNQNTTNPFGNTNTNVNQTVSSSTVNTNQGTNLIKNTASLIQLYKNPTGGAVMFEDQNNEEVIRFVDRANGNVYEYIPVNQTGQPDRITNTTIPKIQEAVWLSGGSDLVMRYLKDNTDSIVSFLSSIVLTTDPTTKETTGAITGSFITPDIDIQQLVTSPAGDKIFGLLEKNNNAGTYGFTMTSDGKNQKQIFDSSIQYWNISWPKSDTITFTTKPSYKYPGYLFFYNPSTGAMNKIMGGMNGLSTLTSNDASMVAYSTNNGNSFTFDVYDVKNKVSKNIQANTLADKCIWGINDTSMLYCAIPNSITGANYPDAWYQGIVSFSDNIWSINTKTGEIKLVYQIGVKENAEIDAFNLKISPDDSYITFMNKSDLSFWMLQIK